MKSIAELKVADYMTCHAIVVEETDRLSDAIETMNEHVLSAVPVVDVREKVVGILTNSDILEVMHQLNAELGAINLISDATRDLLLTVLASRDETTLVLDVMSTPVEVVDCQMNLIVAARKACDHAIHHLPVVDKDGKPSGILAMSDFVRALAEHGPVATG